MYLFICFLCVHLSWCSLRFLSVWLGDCHSLGAALHCCHIKYSSCPVHSFHMGLRLCEHILPQRVDLVLLPLLRHILTRLLSFCFNLSNVYWSVFTSLDSSFSFPWFLPLMILLQGFLLCHLLFVSSLFPCFFQFLFAEITHLIMRVTHSFIIVSNMLITITLVPSLIVLASVP